MNATLLLAALVLGAPITVRAPGKVAQRLAPETLEQVEGERHDLQLGKALSYRGVPLATLLAKAGATGPALLRFTNGMLVPVDPKAAPKVFVATAVKREGKWSADFDPLPGPPPGQPIGNKLVHAASPGFTPWRHVDSLASIELVDPVARAARFDVGPRHREGQRVYLARCQFCHGFDGQGATFGWDFSKLPAISKKSAVSLHYHVRYKSGTAAKGRRMPALPELTRAEAKALHGWAHAMQKRAK